MCDFPALSRWSAPSPAFLAFVHWYTCWDELEDNPFKCREQYPSGNKKFLPRSGQGRGRCCPPVAVEAETNMENSILWRQREEEDVGGSWFISVGVRKAWIAVTNLGQLKWSLRPKNLSPSYKFNFCPQWQTAKNKAHNKRRGKKRDRKLKRPCLHACLKCYAPRLPPLIPPVSLSDEMAGRGGGRQKGSN